MHATTCSSSILSRGIKQGLRHVFESGGANTLIFFMFSVAAGGGGGLGKDLYRN